MGEGGIEYGRVGGWRVEDRGWIQGYLQKEVASS